MIFAFIKNSCFMLPFAFFDCQNTVMLLKIYSRWVMSLLTVSCSLQNLLVEGGGNLKNQKFIGTSMQWRQVIELCFQSRNLNINMLCSELEKSPLFLPSSSQIKSFRKIMEMSDCIQVRTMNHNDMIQFFSECVFKLYCIHLIRHNSSLEKIRSKS